MSGEPGVRLVEAVAPYAPAEDVDDLDPARRLIAAPRMKIARMEAAAEL